MNLCAKLGYTAAVLTMIAALLVPFVLIVRVDDAILVRVPLVED